MGDCIGLFNWFVCVCERDRSRVSKIKIERGRERKIHTFIHEIMVFLVLKLHMKLVLFIRKQQQNGQGEQLGNK